MRTSEIIQRLENNLAKVLTENQRLREECAHLEQKLKEATEIPYCSACYPKLCNH